MKVVFNNIKIFSNNFVLFERVIGHIEMELKKMEPQYINNIGNSKLDTQDE